jgi:sugar lactone lactonase YvrE
MSTWGRKGKARGEFAAAHGLAIDSRDRVYVADRGNNRVQVFDLSGEVLAEWAGFGNPFGLLVAGPHLMVTDGDAHRISHLALDGGRVEMQWGDPQTLQLPHLMALDSHGRLYVAEVTGKRVQIFKRR